MTAEIAILNKYAVVLAADSAVTVGGGTKIFDTVNKIFEISDSIGLMIFNNPDFVGFPLEVLAKKFRRSYRDKKYSTVKECKEEFVKFLISENNLPDDLLFENSLGILEAILSDLMKDLSRDLSIIISKNIKNVQTSKFNGALHKILEADKKLVTSLYDKIDGMSKFDFSKKLEDGLIKSAELIFKPVVLTDTSKNKIKSYVKSYIKSQRMSPRSTGLVFSGYGEEEIFPSLVHVELDGIFDGNLRQVVINEVDIDRRKDRGILLGFAQDDMVQSFVNGTDPLFRAFSEELLFEAMQSSALLVAKGVYGDDTKANALMSALAANFDSLAEDFRTEIKQFVASKFTQDVQSMVMSMPRQEMANLAEALIDITSMKRRVTRQQESVGGDVDVAVISKSEGLVWVKRKHYFPAEINSRFFGRQGGRK